MGDTWDSLGQPTPIPLGRCLGLGDGRDTGTEGVCGGQEGLPETEGWKGYGN